MARYIESNSQQAFVRWWDLAHRGLCGQSLGSVGGVPDRQLLFAIPNGGARNPITGAILKAEGVRRGVPDLFLAVPHGGAHGLFLEFKTGTGRVSDEQERMMALLRRQGYVCAVVRNFEQAQDMVVKYLYIRGEAVPV
jgi:hypothetical protein